MVELDGVDEQAARPRPFRFQREEAERDHEASVRHR
jgi:hypothetical protein